MTEKPEKAEATKPIKRTNVTLSGVGRPTVRELIAALGSLDPDATVSVLATAGGQTRPTWRVDTETVVEAIG